MKVICTQENLLRGIQFASHVAGKNASLPILNNVLLSAGSAGLDILATNLEVGIRARVRAKVEEEGDFSVNAKLFLDYVHLLSKGDNVILESGKDELKVSCGSQQSHIKGVSAEDFPILPTMDDEEVRTYRLPTTALLDAIQKTLFSVSINDVRPELSGVLFYTEGQKLTVVGTDSYRLAETTQELTEASSDCKMIVPGKTWSELSRLASLEMEGNAVLCVSPTQLSVEIGDVYLISRLIEGQYPDYKQIIPSNFQVTVRASREELSQAIKAAALFSKVGINDVVLTIEKQRLRISSSNQQVGENVMDVAALCEGADTSITFNHRYVLDGLQTLTGEQVTLSLVDKNSPGVLRSESDKAFLYIVMPIKQ